MDLHTQKPVQQCADKQLGSLAKYQGSWRLAGLNWPPSDSRGCGHQQGLLPRIVDKPGDREGTTSSQHGHAEIDPGQQLNDWRSRCRSLGEAGDPHDEWGSQGEVPGRTLGFSVAPLRVHQLTWTARASCQRQRQEQCWCFCGSDAVAFAVRQASIEVKGATGQATAPIQQEPFVRRRTTDETLDTRRCLRQCCLQCRHCNPAEGIRDVHIHAAVPVKAACEPHDLHVCQRTAEECPTYRTRHATDKITISTNEPCCSCDHVVRDLQNADEQV
mmetsp:Transcript_7136/g.20197  ORF Transcript_7136/g.20197 Transcript_7136/m.20197 type:complete len:273 (-) Transcript_7136:332-1150(-)